MSEPEAGESTGMRGQMTHLDTDVLAEFRAGLIGGRRGARIAAHLAGCERCTAVDEQLAGVRSLLASVPALGMPDSVARRLDTVLAAEVAHRNVTQGDAAQRDQAERVRGDGTGESPAPRRPGGNRGFRLLTLRVLAPAAAVVVLAAGGYGLSRINLGSSTGSTASSSAGGAARAVAPTAAASAKSGGHVNAPAAGPSKAAVPRPQGITAASFVVRVGQQELLPCRAQRSRSRAELLVPSGSRAPQTATTRISRLRAGKLAGGQPAAAGRERQLRGQPGHPRRRPHRRRGHRLDSGPGLLGHPPSRARHHLAAIGNLRALVSVHWKASQMRG